MSDTRDTLPTSGDAFPAATSTPTGSSCDRLGRTHRTEAAVWTPPSGRRATSSAPRRTKPPEWSRPRRKRRRKSAARRAPRFRAFTTMPARSCAARPRAGRPTRRRASVRERRTARSRRRALEAIAEWRPTSSASISHRLDGVASWLGSRDPGEPARRGQALRAPPSRRVPHFRGARGRRCRPAHPGGRGGFARRRHERRQLTTGYDATDARLRSGTAYPVGKPVLRTRLPSAQPVRAYGTRRRDGAGLRPDATRPTSHAAGTAASTASHDTLYRVGGHE